MARAALSPRDLVQYARGCCEGRLSEYRNGVYPRKNRLLVCDPHREFCRNHHRIIGHFLAVPAWMRGLECIVLVRDDLEAFLGLKRFKTARVRWLMEDLKPWFPSQTPYYKTTSPSSIHSLFLARVPMKEHLPVGSMTTAERIADMDARAPRTERLTTKDDGSEVPSLPKIVSMLSVSAAGLDAPKRTRRRRPKKANVAMV